MGKPTGFIDYQRELPPSRNPQARVADWDEYRSLPDEALLQRQSARCMDCGIPFCHSGVQIEGRIVGCPVNNLIPEWNDLVFRGQWKEAYLRLSKTNNFPEFTGRVCPAPCEQSCVLGINDPPVTIKSIESAIVDRAFEEGWVRPRPPVRRTGKRVVVVGSGPAGLACAAQLNRAGHLVTVLERDDRIGGLLVYGIPSMKLDKDTVQRRVDLLAEEGIKFVTNTEVGSDYPAKKLLAEFDAVALCGGATNPRDLTVDGRQLEGIHFAMDFLKRNTRSWLDSKHLDQRYISANDLDVVVIGGGDTGTDCVATALRHDCRSLVQFEILLKPSSERAENEPWPRWPNLFVTDYGQEEALAVFSGDPREYAVMTTRFVGDENGRIKELHTCQVKWEEKDGRLVPEEIVGTEKVYPAQLVLLAMGFMGPENTLLQNLGVEQDSNSNAMAEFGSYETNLQGVFAAGDMRRGQSLVVWAIREGRGAARECDRYLMGDTSLP